MEIPNNITFFIPSTIEKLDQTTDPTIEGCDGTDYLGNTFGDGTQIVNAMDSYSNRPFDAKATSLTWRTDAELDEREDVGFIMVDQHNIRSNFPASVKEQIDMHYNTVDTFATSTQAVMTKELSGKLGKDQYINLDGVDDNVTVSDSSEIDFGTGSFSVEILFRLNTLTDDAIIYSKKADTTASSTGWAIHYDSSNNTFVFNISYGSTNYNTNSGTNQRITAGTLYHIVCVRNVFTPLQIMYINGVASTDTIATNLGDVSNSEDFVIGDDDSGTNPSEIDVYRSRLFNRSLSETEVLSLANGNSIAEADEWVGVEADLLDDNQATSDQLTEGDSVADWTGLDAAIASRDVGDDGVAPHDGTYKMSLTLTDTIGYASQFIPLTIGKRYRFSAWLQDEAASIANLTIRVGTGLGLADLGVSEELVVGDTWVYKEVEFIATVENTYFSIRKKGAVGNVFFADNVSVKQIGCVAEYDPSGINKVDGKWYDSSSNDLDGTITGAKYVNVPISSDDYYLGVFSAEVAAQFWFAQFNANTETAVVQDTTIGQIAFGKAYTFPTQLLPTGGYSGDYDFPGIILNETDTGRFQSEEKFGARPTWTLNFALISPSQFKDMREMLDFLRGSNYPFWVSFNYDSLDPIIWRVRLDGGLSWSYQYGPVAQPWSPQLRLIKDI